MNSTTRISRRISEEFFSRAGRTVRLLAASIVICFLLPASFPTKARAAEAIASKTAVVDAQAALPHCRSRSHRNPFARLHPDLAHVETDHPTFGREVYRDCT
jgi:hypothetical protein